jgi:endoglucanase
VATGSTTRGATPQESTAPEASTVAVAPHVHLAPDLSTGARTVGEMLRRILPLLGCAIVSLATPAIAAGAPPDPLGFHLATPNLVVHENAGNAVITVERTNTTQEAWIRYVAVGPGHPCGNTTCTAQYDWDFKSVQGTLDFPPGVSTQTFNVPIIDHHADTIPQTLQVSLYGPYPIGLADPSTAVLTILNDDPPNQRPAGNQPANPLAGDQFYVDRNSVVALAEGQYPALGLIAAQPWVERFGSFSGPDVGMAVAHYLARASVQAPGTVPMLSTYRIVDGHCGHWADPPADQDSYDNLISRFASGIGSYRAVLFLEMDSLITVGCLSPHGVAVRMHELNYAINVLTKLCPNLVIYLDAGAADAGTAAQTASLLRRAGVARIQGFFTNSTHFDWTSREILYGEQISRLTGGKHFVVNTSDNGRGPLAPRDPVHQGNEVLCNPPGRGLGPLPTAATGYPNVDAFAWILHPGESTGLCGAGAPPTGVFWPAYALMLLRNAVYTVH